MRNVRLAFRTLFRTPFVTAVAMLSLALGIGANAAIFSLFDQVLLRPLPVPEPQRLVNLAAPGPQAGSAIVRRRRATATRSSATRCSATSRRAPGRASAGLAGHRTLRRQPRRAGPDASTAGAYWSRARTSRSSASRPALGRLLGPERRSAIGAGYTRGPQLRVLWRRPASARIPRRRPADHRQRPDADDRRRGPARTSTARRSAAQPAGVRPHLDAWTRSAGASTGSQNRRSYWVYLFARLKPGVTLEQAAAAVNGVYRAIINDVEAPLQKGMSDEDAGAVQGQEDRRLADGRRGQSSVAPRGEDAAHSCCSASPASCCSSPAPTSPTCCWRAAREPRQWRWRCACRSARRGGS